MQHQQPPLPTTSPSRKCVPGTKNRKNKNDPTTFSGIDRYPIDVRNGNGVRDVDVDIALFLPNKNVSDAPRVTFLPPPGVVLLAWVALLASNPGDNGDKSAPPLFCFAHVDAISALRVRM